MYVHTSVHLPKMLDRAEANRVSIEWLMEQLGRRSFGLTLFLMAVIAFLPGAARIVSCRTFEPRCLYWCWRLRAA
jgi:hypothetical protein